MKAINFKFLGVFILFLCVFVNQEVFAVDNIILRKDDPSSGNIPGSNALMSTSTTTTTSLKTKSSIPVTADIINGELGVFFSRSVGTAYISIIDQNGTIVGAEILDTTTDLELYIPIDGLPSGSYKLKISYGSTNLVGSFQL